LNISAIPDIIGLSDKSSGQTILFNQSIKQFIKPIKISIDYTFIEHYYDFNRPMNIVPPKEALNATPMEPDTTQE